MDSILYKYVKQDTLKMIETFRSELNRIEKDVKSDRRTLGGILQNFWRLFYYLGELSSLLK